jgi:cardiolipin synthase
MRLLVDSEAFLDQLATDIGQASRSVCLQMMSFEGDATGRRLAGLLLERPDLDRTLIIDRYCLYDVNDRFLPAPWNAVRPSLWRELRGTLRLVGELRAGGVRVHWTNPVGVLLLKFVARNHKKLALVDDRLVYFGGLNVCDHNFAWHDVMLRVDDASVAAFVREDVNATLRGVNLPHRGSFGGIEVVLLDGVDNPRLSEPIVQLIRDARRSIVVQSPYMSFPFYAHLGDAVRRGVSVTLMAPECSNKPRIHGYTQWAASAAGISLRLYQGRMSHLKAMLVDDAALVIGSSNFDFLSYHVQQENMAIVRDPAVVEQYRREVLEADLARCVSPSRTINPAWQWWRDRVFRGVAHALIAARRCYPDSRTRPAWPAAWPSASRGDG